MRANAREGIGKELKIKRMFYVSSRDVRIVCPRLRNYRYVKLILRIDIPVHMMHSSI
jgi:hypothetical protein